MADLSHELFGDYRLLRKLGEGSFGIVYQAEHILLGSQAAIKVLHGQMTEAERLALRAEARRQAALEHPHIMPVLTYAEQPVPYLVMKYAPNGTLDKCYHSGQCQRLATILPHVRQIAEGLQYAHDQQTLHLDLKPTNILLGSRQEALITDFGISLILHQQKTHQTVGHIAGTPAYMAPEQLQGKPARASDQYALATMVYQWLTGMQPFTGDVWAMGILKLTQDPVPLRQYASDLSLEVEQVVLKALACDPKNRFESVQAFAKVLTEASHRRGSGSAIIAPPQQQPSGQIPPTIPARPASRPVVPAQTQPARQVPSVPPMAQQTPLVRSAPLPLFQTSGRNTFQNMLGGRGPLNMPPSSQQRPKAIAMLLGGILLLAFAMVGITTNSPTQTLVQLFFFGLPAVGLISGARSRFSQANQLTGVSSQQQRQSSWSVLSFCLFLVSFGGGLWITGAFIIFIFLPVGYTLPVFGGEWHSAQEKVIGLPLVLLLALVLFAASAVVFRFRKKF